MASSNENPGYCATDQIVTITVSSARQQLRQVHACQQKQIYLTTCLQTRHSLGTLVSRTSNMSATGQFACA